MILGRELLKIRRALEDEERGAHQNLVDLSIRMRVRVVPPMIVTRGLLELPVEVPGHDYREIILKEMALEELTISFSTKAPDGIVGTLLEVKFPFVGKQSEHVLRGLMPAFLRTQALAQSHRHSIVIPEERDAAPRKLRLTHHASNRSRTPNIF